MLAKHLATLGLLHRYSAVVQPAPILAMYEPFPTHVLLNSSGIADHRARSRQYQDAIFEIEGSDQRRRIPCR